MLCKYKDLEVVWVLNFKETLFQAKHRIMKYCLYEEPEPKKQDYKSSISGMFIQIKSVLGLGMTSLSKTECKYMICLFSDLLRLVFVLNLG